MHPQDSTLPPWVVLHLPHVSTVVPPGVRDQFLLDDDALAAEMDRLTDHYALELFLDDDCSSSNIRATVSRVVVDMERFVDDAQEPAARHGFGAIYPKTTTGEQLRRHLNPGECEALLQRHADHHARLAVAVDAVRRQHGRCRSSPPTIPRGSRSTMRRT
jgi:N-formylglutamate deformylase